MDFLHGLTKGFHVLNLPGPSKYLIGFSYKKKHSFNTHPSHIHQMVYAHKIQIFHDPPQEWCESRGFISFSKVTSSMIGVILFAFLLHSTQTTTKTSSDDFGVYCQDISGLQASAASSSLCSNANKFRLQAGSLFEMMFTIYIPLP